MSKYFTLIIVLLALNLPLSAQTQKDTIYTQFTKTPVVIDGSDKDACWSTAQWNAINQVWLPSPGSIMKEGDFAGRYKVAWDKDYLYLLVEVKDNVLNDDFPQPMDNYWNDDCVEIFLDEDRSGGEHERSYNAFAYHVSLFYDVIDGGTGATVNLKNNMKVVMDTIADKTYLWEFAIKVFTKNFNPNSPEASRVKLSPKKLMGFSLAYCDNDGKRERENFIGSVVMPKGLENVSYQKADYFGTMLLVDEKGEWLSSKKIDAGTTLMYPNPTTNTINIESEQSGRLEIFTTTGALVQSNKIEKGRNLLNLSNLKKGNYLFRLTGKNNIENKLIVKE